MRINKSLITQSATGGGGSGSVTSVGLTVSVPTGLSQSVSGSPITTSGTIAVSLSFAAGYAIPTTVKQSEWDDAYTWVAAFPTQTGNAGKYLRTDGSNLIWTSLVSPAYGTTGQVQMNNGGDLYANADLYFDIMNSRLGIGVGGTYIHKTLVVHTTSANNQFLLSGTAPGVEFGDNTSGTFTYRAQIGMATSSGHFATNSVAGDLVHWVDTGKNMLWAINSVEKIKLLSTGQFKLAGYTSTSSFTGTAAGYLAFDSSGNILSAAAPSGTNIYNSDGTLTGNRILTLSTYYLRIAGTTTTSFFSTGNVTIGGTTDAGYKLDIQGTGRFTGNLYLSTSGAYLYSDTNNIRLYDKNNRIVLQAYPSGVSNSEVYLSGASIGKISLTDTSIGAYISDGNVGNTNQNSFIVRRGFFGNIGATNKIVLSVQSALYSNLTNGTVLTGVYIDINDTSTFTGFTNIRAIHSIRGGAYFNTSSINSSAILQTDSTTQGFLPPRMTNAQRTAISSPAVGLIVYCTDAIEGLYVYKSGGWTFVI